MLYNAVCNNETPWEASRSQDVGFEDELYVWNVPHPIAETGSFLFFLFLIAHQPLANLLKALDCFNGNTI